MTYDLSVEISTSYEQAITQVKQTLKEQGFGTLTEIDVRQTLADKLGHQMEEYIILGACNPELAHRALEVEREIGLLLPCNVVVRRSGNKTVVQAMDPEVMVRITQRPEMEPIAQEAGSRLKAALKALTDL